MGSVRSFWCQFFPLLGLLLFTLLSCEETGYFEVSNQATVDQWIKLPLPAETTTWTTALQAENFKVASLLEEEQRSKWALLIEVLTPQGYDLLARWENEISAIVLAYSLTEFNVPPTDTTTYRTNRFLHWNKEGLTLSGTLIAGHFYLSTRLASLERLVDQSENGTLNYFVAPTTAANTTYFFRQQSSPNWSGDFPFLSRSGIGIALHTSMAQGAVYAQLSAETPISSLLSFVPAEAEEFSVFPQKGLPEFGGLRAYVRLGGDEFLLARYQGNQPLGSRVETYLNVDLRQSIVDHLGFGKTEVYWYGQVDNHLWQAKSKAALRSIIRSAVGGGSGVLNRPEISQLLSSDDLTYLGLYLTNLEGAAAAQTVVISRTKANWKVSTHPLPDRLKVGWERDFGSEITFFHLDYSTSNWVVQTANGNVFFSALEDQPLLNCDPLIGTPYFGTHQQLMLQTQREVFRYADAKLDTLPWEAAAPMLSLHDPMRDGSRHYFPADDGYLRAFDGNFEPLMEWDSSPYTSRLFSSPVILGDAKNEMLLCHTAALGLLGLDRSGQKIALKEWSMDTLNLLGGPLKVPFSDPYHPDFFNAVTGNEFAALGYEKTALLQTDLKGQFNLLKVPTSAPIKDYLLIEWQQTKTQAYLVLTEKQLTTYAYDQRQGLKMLHQVALPYANGQLFRLYGKRGWGVFFAAERKFILFGPDLEQPPWLETASLPPFFDPASGNILLVRGAMLTSVGW